MGMKVAAASQKAVTNFAVRQIACRKGRISGANAWH
jgi:hypothetical protein